MNQSSNGASGKFSDELDLLLLSMLAGTFLGIHFLDEKTGKVWTSVTEPLIAKDSSHSRSKEAR